MVLFLLLFYFFTTYVLPLVIPRDSECLVLSQEWYALLVNYGTGEGYTLRRNKGRIHANWPDGCNTTEQQTASLSNLKVKQLRTCNWRQEKLVW